MQVEAVELPPAKSIWRMLLESREDDCQELVKELMEKSERLKAEATKPEVVRSLAAGMAQHPGLSLVGSSDEALRRIGEEAIETVDSLMSGKETVDRFLCMHVKPIKALLEQGAEVDDALVEELLATPGARTSEPSREISREVAYEFADAEQAVAEISLKGGSNQPAAVAEGPLLGPLLLDDDKLVGSADNKASSGSGQKWSGYVKKDTLTLAGLLNVLDGVVDTPGRMLIMTTNHPELLDPALIRPGRIDKKILLGFMAAADVVLMLEHYFQEKLTNKQKIRVDEAIHGNHAMHRPALQLTPAQIEQLAAEHDELEDMIAALEAKGQSKVPHGLPKPEVSRRTTSYSSIAFGV